MRIFFTSDTHFANEDILIRENRKFKNSKIFAKYIIKIWNKQTKKNDILYHLGDFCNYNKKDNKSWKKGLNYVKKIKCKVILIIGNNEERVIKNIFKNDFNLFKKYCLKIGFLDVYKDLKLKINNQKFYLCHIPIKPENDYINLFGHVHRSTGLWKPYGINIGCDLNHFYLYNTNEIFRILDLKEQYWDNDINNYNAVGLDVFEEEDELVFERK